MVNIVVQIPAILKRFLGRFKDIFPKPLFVSFCFYVSGLFLELKRTNIQSISLKVPLISYERLQYFISEGSWDYEGVNDRRIKIIESNRATRSSKRGVVVIDDSGCVKWGMSTEGACVQYLGSSNSKDKLTNCNVFVASAYCDSVKRFPINLKPYIPKGEFPLKDEDPKFNSKIKLAKKLVLDAVKKGIDFSDFVFDNWYLANDFVGFIEKGLHRTWISELEADRLISYRGKWVRAGELVKLIPCTKFNRRVTVPNSQGEERSFLIYGFITKIKGGSSRVLAVVAMGRWDKNDPKDVHVFATNHASLSAGEVVRRFALRWGIECLFRDLKENVAFDHYQVRTIQRITRHWHLAALAYTFLYWVRLTGGFTKTFHTKMHTMGATLNAFRKLNSESSVTWIAKNPQQYQDFLGIQRSHRRQIAA